MKVGIGPLIDLMLPYVDKYSIPGLGPCYRGSSSQYLLREGLRRSKIKSEASALLGKNLGIVEGIYHFFLYVCKYYVYMYYRVPLDLYTLILCLIM